LARYRQNFQFAEQEICHSLSLQEVKLSADLANHLSQSKGILQETMFKF